ncbi:MAG: NADH-quinone oxidoreductase subunit C [Anaerolineae bacterium]|nr:NADH-quinone oxidoreductase subunit C [Anaerolineae bacterium]
MTELDIISRLQAALPGLAAEPVEGAKDPTLRVPVGDLVRVASWLRDEAGYDYLSNVTGVDRGEQFEVVYHLYSIAQGGGPLVLKVSGPWDQATVPSLVGIWPAAEFQEREVYDLLGISFAGHPDLRRILLWEGFPGHPLRKTFENRTVPNAEMVATMADEEVPHAEN